jgi:hypothetical protein
MGQLVLMVFDSGYCICELFAEIIIKRQALEEEK